MSQEILKMLQDKGVEIDYFSYTRGEYDASPEEIAEMVYNAINSLSEARDVDLDF